MRIEARCETDEAFDNLTVASAVVWFCEECELDPVKVAKAILVEKEREQV